MTQATRLTQPQRVQPNRVQLMIAQLTRVQLIRVQPNRVQNYFYNFYEYTYKVKVIHKKNKLFSLHNILCMKMLHKLTKGKK